MGAVANSYMRKGFLIYEEMRKYLVIYEEAFSHIWLCNRSLLDFLIYEENFVSVLYVHVATVKKTSSKLARRSLKKRNAQKYSQTRRRNIKGDRQICYLFFSLFGGFSVMFLWNEPNSEPTSKYRIDEESARSEIFIY